MPRQDDPEQEFPLDNGNTGSVSCVSIRFVPDHIVGAKDNNNNLEECQFHRSTDWSTKSF